MSFDIPPLPGTHIRALALVGQPDVTFHDLAEVVALDPGLTAAVLRAANSAISSPVHPIETANHALVRIGIEQARRIMTGAIVAGNLSNLRFSGINLTQLWRHVVATALIADVTAWGEVRRSSAFTAGLLHDIGRLVMAHRQPAEYARVIAMAHDGDATLDAEYRVFGTDHVALGFVVAHVWNIPGDIAAAIGSHHDGTGSAMAWTTWNSRRVAWDLGIGDGIVKPEGPAQALAPPDAEIVAALGGAEQFLAQVDWYCGAMTGAVAAGRA